MNSKAMTILYTKNVISKADAPKMLKDLLNPKWKGKIASTLYAAGFGPLGEHKNWDNEETLDYTRALTANLGGMTGCGSWDRIISGEFPIFVFNCNPGPVSMLIAKGAPMAQNIPLDALVIDHWAMGVPKHAVYPNTAKLLIAWIVTRDGQDKVSQIQHSDLHYLKGSKGGFNRSSQHIQFDWPASTGPELRREFSIRGSCGAVY